MYSVVPPADCRVSLRRNVRPAFSITPSLPLGGLRSHRSPAPDAPLPSNATPSPQPPTGQPRRNPATSVYSVVPPADCRVSLRRNVPPAFSITPTTSHRQNGSVSTPRCLFSLMFNSKFSSRWAHAAPLAFARRLAEHPAFQHCPTTSDPRSTTRSQNPRAPNLPTPRPISNPPKTNRFRPISCCCTARYPLQPPSRNRIHAHPPQTCFPGRLQRSTRLSRRFAGRTVNRNC